jgi:hypothetical protein
VSPGKTRFKKMHRRDQELLDKQLRHVALKRSDSIMIVALVVAFFGGIALGGTLFGPESKPIQTASNETNIHTLAMPPR